MKYLFETSLTLIKRNIVTNVISIISVALALTVPAVFMTQYFTARDNFNEYLSLINLQDVLIVNIVSYDFERLDLVSTDELVENIDFIEIAHLYSRVFSEMVMHNHNFIVGVDLVEISPSISELYDESALYIGSWISNENEAMVGKITANLFEIEIGDTLHVGSNELIITGIFDIPTQNENIWWSFGGVENSHLQSVHYYVKTLESNEYQMNYLENFFQERNHAVDVLQEFEYVERLEARVSSGWLVSAVLSGIAILYSFLNIGIIQSLHVDEHKKNNAIMRALGSSHWFVLFQEIVRTFIVSLVASSISFVILSLISYYNIFRIIEMRVGYQTFFFTWFVSFIVMNFFVIWFHFKTSRISISAVLK